MRITEHFKFSFKIGRLKRAVPAIRPGIRDHLLRGVYEDNLRITETLPRGEPLEPHEPARVTRIALILAVLLALFGGIGQDLGPPALDDSLTPDEQIAEYFGTVRDPSPLRQPVGDAGTVANTYGLSVRTIVIDPGHGGRDPGAVGSSGLTEKNVTLDVARRLKRQLESHGFEVFLTRETDVSVSVRNRIRFAVDHKADILLSIHVNALPENSISFIETLYFDPVGTERTRTLAALENASSGFTFAELRNSARDLIGALKDEESKRLAESIQTTVYKNAKRFDPSVRDFGARGGPFAVLSHRWRDVGTSEEISIPSVLAEVSVMSHAPDEERLVSAEYRESIAAALFEGIVNYATPSSSQPNTD